MALLLQIRLFVDLKPNLPCGSERIEEMRYGFKPFGMSEKLLSSRLPNNDSPGLEMAGVWRLLPQGFWFDLCA
ncbi:hypothetical protein IFM89_025340 [Coptis chinensis]|uniref:Uncharacterized protein n=1 Tax=Coptis chinensis TaxID=261450 RepID=A0A835I6I4_9MAGN|nr:hypothetical protein IFM89_025340 [Coptis chinensis]